MDQQLSHTKYLDHLQGNGLKTRGYYGCFKGNLPNLVKNQKVAVEESWSFIRETIAPHELLHKKLEWDFI
jgi:hypothetical protein